MRLVILETPYRADTLEGIAANVAYGLAAARDCVLRGDSPSPSHLVLTQQGCLRDDVPEERELGIEAGLAWCRVSEATVVYTDRGISDGMRRGIERARKAGRPVVYRSLKPGQEELVRSSDVIGCRHSGRCETDSEAVWEYGTPDSSGWSRRCKLCGLVQYGAIPLAT